MKTVIVSFYEASPPASGAATVTYNVATFLSGEKYLIQLSCKKKAFTIDDNFRLINIRNISNNRIFKALNLGLYLPSIIKQIKQITPEIIILEGASWALYYLILFYLMRLSRIKAKIIYHAHNVEYLLRIQKNNKIIAMITKWAEGNVIKKSNLFTAVSEIDALNFEKIFGIRPYILPNGVDIEKFEMIKEEQVLKLKKNYKLDGEIVLFMGLASFKPNKEGIDFLINEVFPLVIKERPNARLAVIGGDIECRKDWLINPGIISFEEVPVFIKACDICVAPIFSGSGTRLKILEYMAAGKPVVSTPKGAEGIMITNDKNILIADNANEFVEEILYLFKHPAIGKAMGKESKELIRENYSWGEIMQDFNGKLISLLR